MKKNIFSKTCGVLLLLIVCLPIRSSVKDKGYSSNSNIKQNKTETISKTSPTKSPKTALLDTLKVSSRTRIVGYSFKHNSNLSDFYSFLLKDSASIVQFIKSLEVGEEIFYINDANDFNVSIVNNYAVTNTIYFDPLSNTITLDGKTFKFDFGLIIKSHKEHSIICEVRKINFSNKKEAGNYVNEIKKDTNLLFYYAPEFNYEGSFNITINKTTQLENPRAAMIYLSTEIEKIVKHDEYQISYHTKLNPPVNMIQSDIYVITIDGSRKLFDNLIVNKVTKDNWKSFDKEMGYFYFKK